MPTASPRKRIAASVERIRKFNLHSLEVSTTNPGDFPRYEILLAGRTVCHHRRGATVAAWLEGYEEALYQESRRVKS